MKQSNSWCGSAASVFRTYTCIRKARHPKEIPLAPNGLQRSGAALRARLSRSSCPLCISRWWCCCALLNRKEYISRRKKGGRLRRCNTTDAAAFLFLACRLYHWEQSLLFIVVSLFCDSLLRLCSLESCWPLIIQSCCWNFGKGWFLSQEGISCSSEPERRLIKPIHDGFS